MTNQLVGNTDVDLGKNCSSFPNHPNPEQVSLILENETVYSIERKVGLKKSKLKSKKENLETREPEDFLVSDHTIVDRKSRINRLQSPLIAEKIHGSRQGSSRTLDYDRQLSKGNERKRAFFNYFTKSGKPSSSIRLQQLATSISSSFQEQKGVSPKISNDEISRSDNIISKEQMTSKVTTLNKSDYIATSSKVSDGSRSQIASHIDDKSMNVSSDEYSYNSNEERKNETNVTKVSRSIETQETELNEMLLNLSSFNTNENPNNDPSSQSYGDNYSDPTFTDGTDISINDIIRVDTSKSKNDLQYPGSILVDIILTGMNNISGLIQNVCIDDINAKPNDSLHSLSQVYLW